MAAPIELIVAAFDGEGQAGHALEQLQQLRQDGVVRIINAAVMVKTKDGKSIIKETEDVRAPAGAVFGAIVGGLVGLLGGPAGVIVGAAAGAATGGLAAHEIDMGFDDHDLKDIQASLPAGSSAIIALVALEWVERVVNALEELDAKLWRQVIKGEMLEAMDDTPVAEDDDAKKDAAPAPKDQTTAKANEAALTAAELPAAMPAEAPKTDKGPSSEKTQEDRMENEGGKAVDAPST